MAGSSDRQRLNFTYDADSRLGDEWDRWSENFESESAAAREALRRGIFDSDSGGDGPPAVYAGPVTSLAITAMMAAAVASLVAQAALVFDMVIASGLTALALVVVGGVMYVYGE